MRSNEINRVNNECDRDPVLDDEREEWLNLSIQGLREAYGKDEPGYSTDLIKEVNPQYMGVKSPFQHS